MQMSISLITLWYNFTYCVSQGTGLTKTNSAIWPVMPAFAPERRHIDAQSGRRLRQGRAVGQYP